MFFALNETLDVVLNVARIKLFHNLRPNAFLNHLKTVSNHEMHAEGYSQLCSYNEITTSLHEVWLPTCSSKGVTLTLSNNSNPFI